MADIRTGRQGRAGRITLARPKALNALTHEMSLALEAALDQWREDSAVALVLIGAEGERAFCAGGDIAKVWRDGQAGDLETPRRFWREEYRMNAKLADYPKPVVALMQGFVMGGGVGIGGHLPHRIVGATSQVAMPECNIGLIPDVGGTWLLSRAPGRIGEYLGLTGARMGPADAIHAGFADHFVPEEHWPALIERLVAEGSPAAIADFATPPPPGELAGHQPLIDVCFAAPDPAEILARLDADGGAFAQKAAAAMRRNSPLSMACSLEMIRRARSMNSVREALAQEYRYTYRALGETDLSEGIRAQVIDKDRQPKWRHAAIGAVSAAEVAHLLGSLGPEEWTGA